MSDDDAALQKKAANLIDHGGPLTDKTRPYPVQRLQIQLLVGLSWNKASRRPLHQGISEIILVPPHSQSRWGPERGRSIPFATNFSLEPDVSFRDEAEVGWRQSSLSRSKMTLLGITNKSDFVFARPRPETSLTGWKNLVRRLRRSGRRHVADALGKGRQRSEMT